MQIRLFYHRQFCSSNYVNLLLSIYKQFFSKYVHNIKIKCFYWLFVVFTISLYLVYCYSIARKLAKKFLRQATWIGVVNSNKIKTSKSQTLWLYIFFIWGMLFLTSGPVRVSFNSNTLPLYTIILRVFRNSPFFKIVWIFLRFHSVGMRLTLRYGSYVESLDNFL